MIRTIYIPIFTKDKDTPEKVLMNKIWCVEDEPPDVPYIKVECEVVDHETRYVKDREDK